ncbi:Cyclic 2,3-diphosphoglycerate synthetase [uncultured archaeon]|nr:Cyclic 2,3-diphosphoglycerate synthetase [uncultured archaeon]
MVRKKVIILGAAGRDFHLFNTLFRTDENYDVIAFTANQIPFISDRLYPKELSGKLYPSGVKIHDESELSLLIKKHRADICILAYSDLNDVDVMHKASLANSCGADFWLVAPERTMLKSSKPVIAVCAVRTGAGKSPTSRYVAKALREMGVKTVIIRHPMPYGDLRKQIVERFETLKDLDKYKTTIEEREDYEPHIRNGFVVYAGVDYERILRQAEKEADVVIWDGGNNDTPFVKPDLMITIADPLRAGSELTYYPGETCARLADLLIINKVDSAAKSDVERVRTALEKLNPKAKIILADSVVTADNPHIIKGKSALLVEDGPTITHGNMLFGAATIAAKQYGAGEVVDAKPYAVGTVKATFEKYNISKELPAMGYNAKQIKDLETTINRADCDIVISATPTNLRHLVNSNKPIVQVSYEIKPRGNGLDEEIKKFVKRNR